VAVELPPDVLSERTGGAAIGPEPAGTPSPGSADDLGAAAERLAAAERPLLLVGGGAGAAVAWDELARLAETLGAPMVSTTNGKGSYDDRHPLAFLPLAARELVPRADCVLFIGSRGLDSRGNPPRTAEGATLLSLNIDPDAFSAPRSFDVTITGDARTGAAALAELLAGSADGTGSRAPWVTDADDVRQRVLDDLSVLEPQMSYARALRAAIPDDGVLVNELTQVGYVGRFTYDVRHPRSYVDPGYQGTLGYGYPTAIGAAVGNPDRPVVSVNGDGGFGYGLAEMATVMNHDIPLVGVVFRDDAYGNVQRMHRQQFEGDHLGTELTNPDMLALAAAFGMSGYRAETPDDFQRMLSAAIDAREPALIDVPLGVVPDPWAVIYKRRPDWR
jgi:acetolactate synthase-1/2/3 large subunit